ncbi:MAG: hypothetical protein U1G05_00205 [Kiritimatiellia bacterium]
MTCAASPAARSPRVCATSWTPRASRPTTRSTPSRAGPTAACATRSPRSTSSSSCAGGVTEQDVTNIFGLISHRSLADLAGAGPGRRPGHPRPRRRIRRASGKDLYRVMTDLLAMLRDVVVYALTRRKDHLADLPEAQARALTDQAAALDASRLLRVIEILVESEGRLRGSLSRRTLLEVILLRASRAASVATSRS